MSETTILNLGPRPVLRFERHLPDPVETVWRAVTEPEEMRSWFPTRIELVGWKVGASITHHFDGHDIEPLPGKVLEWDPPHRVSFTWGTDTLAFSLAPGADGGTVFVLTEELDANHAARNAAGWEACLDRLESGTEHEAWPDRFARYSAAFTPELGPQDGPPVGYKEPEPDS